MSFWGTQFVFDGVPSSGFDLMLYNVGQSSDSGTMFASYGSIIEETVAQRWKPYFFGVRHDGKLQFEITFGVNQHRIDRGAYLDRFEMAEIAAWLTGHDHYKWLIIDQEDMKDVQFKCMITNLTATTYGDIPWAFRATVICDSAYAYLPEMIFHYGTVDERTFVLRSESSLHTPYSPVLRITPMDAGDITIENLSMDDGAFTLTGLPADTGMITVDCDTGVMYCDNGMNLYEICNLNFPRLIRGDNQIRLTGYAIIDIVCRFPINTGG